MVAQVNPETLKTWLEWGAAKLIAMPAGRLKPTEYRSYWPDYVRDVYDHLHSQDSVRNKIRALAPSSEEIPIVDRIILLPNICEQRSIRHVVHWRAQVHPIRGHYLLDWFWIANKLETKPRTAKLLHKQGLEEIVDKTPSEVLYTIHEFMNLKNSY